MPIFLDVLMRGTLIEPCNYGEVLDGGGKVDFAVC